MCGEMRGVMLLWCCYIAVLSCVVRCGVAWCSVVSYDVILPCFLWEVNFLTLFLVPVIVVLNKADVATASQLQHLTNVCTLFVFENMF